MDILTPQEWEAEQYRLRAEAKERRIAAYATSDDVVSMLSDLMEGARTENFKTVRAIKNRLAVKFRESGLIDDAGFERMAK